MSQPSAHAIPSHTPNVRRYLAVFAVLMFLTVVTVLVSYWHLPVLAAVTLGLAIATLKAGLVAAFFMHLKGERVLIYGILGITILCMALLFLLPIADFALIDTRVHSEAEAADGH